MSGEAWVRTISWKGGKKVNAYCALIAGVAALIAALAVLKKTDEMRLLIIVYWLLVMTYWTYRSISG